MEYRLKIGEQTTEVSVEIEKENSLKASIDQETFQTGYTVISDHHIHLDVGGQGINVYVAGSGAEKTIQINGVSYLVGDADALERSTSKKAGGKDIPQEVTPPMPSVVVRVLVSVGDHVDKGDGVIVVSAMKMETTLQAPYAGNVTKINAAEGDKTMPGDVLVDIEKDEETSPEES
jgi:biotin carboxyl carrier protein